MIFMLISAEYRSKINLQPFTDNGDVAKMSEKILDWDKQCKHGNVNC